MVWENKCDRWLFRLFVLIFVWEGLLLFNDLLFEESVFGFLGVGIIVVSILILLYFCFFDFL